MLAGLTCATGAVAKPISKPRWVRGFKITEYFPAPERWFTGRRVAAPGMTGRHRVDWLYSARGLSMEGDGIALDGSRWHIADTGSQGWVTAAGRRTVPGRRGWSRGRPFWRALGWRAAGGGVTFPLGAGGWWNGRPRRYIEPRGVRFARGPSRPLRPYRSVAVDPRLIPLGSRVFVPAYSDTPGRGWMRAQDVGGAILGRHIDVFTPPPSEPGGGGYLTGESIYVVPPARPG